LATVPQGRSSTSSRRSERRSRLLSLQRTRTLTSPRECLRWNRRAARLRCGLVPSQIFAYSREIGRIEALSARAQVARAWPVGERRESEPRWPRSPPASGNCSRPSGRFRAVQARIVITNSEVGCGTLSVQPPALLSERPHRFRRFRSRMAHDACRADAWRTTRSSCFGTTPWPRTRRPSSRR
jgi:hypothetical protein